MKSPPRLRSFAGRSAARPAPVALRCEPLEDRTTPATLDNFLTTEHVDINLGYSGGTWTLQNRNSDDEDNVVLYDTDAALLYAGTPSLTSRPANGAFGNFDFIGVGPGEDFYRLPQSQDPNLLYLGFAGYGITPGDFDRYNPSAESKGRVGGNGRWLKVSLVDVRHTTPAGAAGDGEFSVWQSDDDGPDVFMSSFNDGVSNPGGNGLDTTDGIAADDALWILAGGHLHYNWGFTQKGRYEVTVKLSGYVGDGGSNNGTIEGTYVESQPFKLYFSVGSVGQLEFDSSTYTVNEAAGTASVTVRRANGSDGRITVDYATSNGAATAGTDYGAASGTLTFNDQETSKVVTVPILDDADDEPNETVNLTLSSPGPSSINNYLIDIEGDADGLLGGQSTATLTIVDNDDPANTAPTISDTADQTTDEDTPTGAIAFTVGDAETPAGDLVVTATSSDASLVPGAGIVVEGSGANRTVTVTPAANASGTATITLTVTDTSGRTATDEFVLTVNPVNDRPTISDVADQAASEDTPTGAIAFSVGDAETAVGALTVTATSSNTALVPNANIVLAGSGADRTVVLTPAANQSGTATITLTVTDAGGLTATNTFVLTVSGQNDAPTISPIGDVVMDEDGDVTINFTVGDAETAAGSLTVTGTGTNTTLFPSVGTSSSARLRLGGSGANRTLRIRPVGNLSGESDVTLTVADANGGTASQTFKITVNAVNDPPRATDDSVFAHVGTATPLSGLLNNDGDIDSSTFGLAGFTQPTSGAVAQGADGVLTYTPQAGFRGFDSFTYTLRDAEGATATATVELSVGVVDLVHTDLDINYLNGEWYSNIHADYMPGAHVDSDEAVLFANPASKIALPALPASYSFIGAATGDDVWLLPQVQDVNLLWLGFSNEDTNPALLAGPVRLDLASFSGPGNFSLFDTDSFGNPRAWIDTADGVNSAGDAAAGGNSADFYTLLVGAHSHLNWTFTQPGRYAIGLRPTTLVNTTGPQGNPIQVSSTGPVVTYYFDVDVLTGTPLPENSPLARDDAASGAAGGMPVTIAVLANDTSAPDPSEPLTVTAVTQGANGGVTIGTGGTTVLYTPAADFSGTDSFTYTITDEHGGTATATVSVTVTPVDEAPVAAPDSYAVGPGNVVRGNVLFNDSDAEGDTLSAAVVAGPVDGTLTLNPDGTFTYAPGPDFAGSDSFTYAVTAGGLTSAPETVTITAAGAQDFEAVLTGGHTDIGLTYEDGEWDLHVHDEENDAEYGPAGALLFVGPQALTTRTAGLAGAAFDFLGVAADESFYRLPESESPELLYLGLGAEEIEDGTFLGDTMALRLRAVNGPGQFSAWRSTDTGPEVLMATSDGVTAADSATVFAGGHDHLNFGFSARGRYEVTFEAIATLPDGTAVSSGNVTYYFSVDNVGRVQFSDAAYSATEGGTVTVTVTRTDGSDGPLTVDYATADGTATAGSDYTAAAGTLTFNDGETQKTFTVATQTDGAADGSETVNLALTAPALGSPATAVLTIVDLPPATGGGGSSPPTTPPGDDTPGDDVSSPPSRQPGVETSPSAEPGADAPPPGPAIGGAVVFNNFLFLFNPSGQVMEVTPMPAGTQAFFTDMTGDGNGDVLVVSPTLGLVMDGFTGRVQVLATDVDRDQIPELFLFAPDGSIRSVTLGRTGQVLS